MILNTFTAPPKSPFVAMDTETHTYVDGAILPENVIATMMSETVTEEKTGKKTRKYPASWWREHVTVKPWAFIIYSPEGAAILETFEEYTKFCAQYRIKTAWWYNAPFDFSLLDAERFAAGWEFVEGKPAAPRQFGELASPFGARYIMHEVHPADTAHTFEKRSVRDKIAVRHYDLKNLLKGGLAQLLKSFDVRDGDGNPVRKGTMNYQAAGAESLTASDIDYMIDDARGLYWLVMTFGKRLASEYGIEIRKSKPDVVTASGLAKILLLRKMYPNAATDKGRKTIYRKAHPVSPELDEYYRRGRLLLGGLVMLNDRARGKHLHGERVNIYRYDYNSHYPAIMHDMPDITGLPCIQEGRIARESPNDVRVFEIRNLHAMTRPGMVASWLDPIEHKVSPEVTVHDWRDGYIMLFDFELEELEKWYTIDTCEIFRTWTWFAKPCPAFAEFVDEHYKKKADAKAAGDKVMQEIEKLILNGVTGKFSQNPNHAARVRRMFPDGVVRLSDPDGGARIDKDESSIMNIVQGAYITAKGRTILRRSARDIAFRSGHEVADVLLYTDTDSLHTIVKYDRTDAYALGWLKQENEKPIHDAVFLAPKTYAEIDETTDPKDGYNFHCKGVRVECLIDAYERGESLGDIYREGREFLSLAAMNVRGGKALLALPKAVCRTMKGDVSDEELYF